MYLTGHAFSLSTGLDVIAYTISNLYIDTHCIYSSFSYVISKMKKNVIINSEFCVNLNSGKDLMCPVEKNGTVVNKVFFFNSIVLLGIYKKKNKVKLSGKE